MDIETVRRIAQLAANVEVSGYKRSFASGILLTCGCLRFTDVQHLRTFEVNDASHRGAFLTAKTQRPRVLNWPWAIPRMCIAGARDWAQPLLDMRSAYTKVDGQEMAFVSPRLGHSWRLVGAWPSPYIATRRKLALLRISRGAPRAKLTHYILQRTCSQMLKTR